MGHFFLKLGGPMFVVAPSYFDWEAVPFRMSSAFRTLERSHFESDWLNDDAS